MKSLLCQVRIVKKRIETETSTLWGGVKKLETYIFMIYGLKVWFHNTPLEIQI